MGKYIIDNNVISNYFAELFSKKATEFVADVIDEIPNISVITEIEALSWQHPDKGKEAIVQSFVDDARIFELSPAIVKECIKIRRSKKMKTPDAIIAATAIVHNFILISSDSDFKNIKGLKVVDPNSL